MPIPTAIQPIEFVAMELAGHRHSSVLLYFLFLPTSRKILPDLRDGIRISAFEEQVQGNRNSQKLYHWKFLRTHQAC